MKPTLLGLTLLLCTAISADAAIVDVFQYRLGEPGTVLGGNNLPQDSSGNGYDETNTHGGGSTAVQTGSPPLTANGSTAYLDFTPSRGFYGAGVAGLPTNNFAVEMWLRADSTSSSDMALQLSGAGSKLAIRRVGSDLRFSYFGVAGIDSQVVPLTTGEWTHAAVIRDSGTTTAYVNGSQLVGSTGHNPSWSGTIHIGLRSGGSEYWDGALDEIRMYTFDPNTDDPVAAFNIGSPIPEPMTMLAVGLSVAGLGGYIRKRNVPSGRRRG